jgi:hypothetical protein
MDLTSSPGTNSRPFVAIIVDFPILQILTLSLSLLALMIELPAPFVGFNVSDYALLAVANRQMKGTALHRSLVLRVVLYFITGFFGIFVYQVGGVVVSENGADDRPWTVLCTLSSPQRCMRRR